MSDLLHALWSLLKIAGLSVLLAWAHARDRTQRLLFDLRPQRGR